MNLNSTQFNYQTNNYGFNFRQRKIQPNVKKKAEKFVEDTITKYDDFIRMCTDEMLMANGDKSVMKEICQRITKAVEAFDI